MSKQGLVQSGGALHLAMFLALIGLVLTFPPLYGYLSAQ